MAWAKKPIQTRQTLVEFAMVKEIKQIIKSLNLRIMSNVLTITDNNFDQVLENKIVLIQFTAEWCAPCRKLGPVIEEVAAAHKDIAVGKVNVDHNPHKSVEHGVLSIPTVVFFKDGKPVERRKGVMSKQDIEKIIEKLKRAE